MQFGVGSGDIAFAKAIEHLYILDPLGFRPLELDQFDADQ